MILSSLIQRLTIFLLGLSLFGSSALSVDFRAYRVSDCIKNLQKLFVPTRSQLFPAGAQASSPIRTFQDLKDSLYPLFLFKDPQGWKDQLKKAVYTEFLDGNNGGAERFVFADGSQVIAKSFRLDPKKYDDARQIVEQQKEWEKKGEGAALKGVSITPTLEEGEVSVKFVMEDIKAPQNSVGSTRVAGMGTLMHSLRPYSQESRKWIANRALELLDKHPDPHAKNVFFRVSQLSPNGKLPPQGSYYREGDLIFQVLLIDATGSEATPDWAARYGNPRDVPEVLLRYNRKLQQEYFNLQLGLP